MIRLLTVFSRWLDDFQKHLFAMQGLRRKKEYTSYETIVLREEVRKKKQDVHYLQYQLAKTRADYSDLEQTIRSYPDAMAEILRLPEEQLQERCHFPVQRAETENAWEVVTERCCIGGCDMGVHAFPTNRDAQIFSALLNAVGYQPHGNVACPSCYAEHMKDTYGNQEVI